MAESDPLLRNAHYHGHGSARDEESETSTPEVEVVDDEKGCGFYIPRRYILVLLLTCGTANSFAVRVNFNVALIAMVNSTDDTDLNNTIDFCPTSGNGDNSMGKTEGGAYNWNSDLQSSLLGAFYYGYPLLQPFAGVMAERFGAKKLLIFAGISGGLLNLLMPVVAQWNVYALIGLRALLGIAMGPLWPAMATIVPRWTLRTERTRLYAACNAGLYVGTVVSQSISGVLCSTDFLGGWPSVFYVFGVISLIWSLLVWLLTADTPAKHPSISWKEKEMIEAHIGDTQYHRPPYKAIATSLPVWCFFIMLLMDITAYDTIFTYLPLYMKRVLKFDIAASGGLASIPYIISIIVTFFAGYTSDLIRNRGWLGTMWIRRIYTILGDTLPSVCVLIITFLNCDRTMVVFFFILAVSLSGFNNGGFNVNMFDIAPRYAGTMFGVINGVSNVGGFVGPLAVGALTQNSSNVQSWHAVFYMVVAVYNFGVIFFCVFGSADLQPWAEPKPKQQDDAQPTEDSKQHQK